MTLTPASRRFRAVRPIRESEGILILDAVDGERNGARARLVVLSGTSSPLDALARFRQSERLAVGMRGLLRPLAAFEPVEELFRGSSWFGNARASTGTLALAYDAPGPSLAERLSGGGMTKAEAAGVVRALGAALGGLHDQGIALGCLQPELVFEVEPSAQRAAAAHDVVGGVLVAGFGVAALGCTLGGPKLVRETQPEAYRAPELTGELPALPEPWSDIYALGVLTTELFAIFAEARTEKVRAILARAVSVSPAARPADVRRWAAELSEAMSTANVGQSAQSEAAANRTVELLPQARASEAAATGEPPAEQRVEAVAVSSEIAHPEQAPPALTSAASGSQRTEPDAVLPLSASGSAQQSAAQRTPRTLAAAIALIAGILLLSAGVGAVFAYVLVAQSALPPSASSSTPAAPPVAPVVAPAPTALSQPDAGAQSREGPDEPIEEFDPGVARGVARSSPEDARAPLPVDASRPVWGSKDALVTLVVFGDLECEHTRRAFSALGRLKHKLGDELRIVWRHRPLAKHEHARSAALYAAALHARSGDEAFFRLVSSSSKSPAPPTARALERWTPSSSEQPTLDAVRAAKVAAERLAQDLVLAGQLRVRATPTLFINGIRVDGYASYDELQRLVERELVGARATLASGIARRELYSRRTLKNLVNIGAP